MQRKHHINFKKARILLNVWFSLATTQLASFTSILYITAFSYLDVKVQYVKQSTDAVDSINGF